MDYEYDSEMDRIYVNLDTICPVGICGTPWDTVGHRTTFTTGSTVCVQILHVVRINW